MEQEDYFCLRIWEWAIYCDIILILKKKTTKNNQNFKMLLVISEG